jgi:hypothetical protein
MTVTPAMVDAALDSWYYGPGWRDVSDADIARLRRDMSAALTAALAVSGYGEVVEALKEVMVWVDNWDPNFVYDDDWSDTDTRVSTALSRITGDQS